MAKEFISPDPIPVGDNTSVDNVVFRCATVIDSTNNCDIKSDLSEKIIDYITSNYSDTGWGDNDNYWEGHKISNMSITEFKHELCNMIEGLTMSNIDQYITIIAEKENSFVVAIFTA